MSEFGTGYATCLLMFVNHEQRLPPLERVYRAWDLPGDKMDMELVLWASGALDHLHDLKQPRRGVPRARIKQALHLHDRMYAAYMAFDERPPVTRAEAHELVALAHELLREVGDPKTVEEAMEIDRGLGLKPNEGDYTCEFPLPAIPGLGR